MSKPKQMCVLLTPSGESIERAPFLSQDPDTCKRLYYIEKSAYDTLLQAALELEKAYSEASIYRYDETFITRLKTIKYFRAVLKGLGEE